MSSKVEICAPAGSYESLAAAIRAGADSIYFGAGRLNMRSRSSASFEEKDLRKIAEICRRSGVNSYLAVNSVIYEGEFEEALNLCRVAKDAGVSAVILSDLALMQAARDMDLPVHVSVQSNITNFEALKAYSRFADIAVLARELNLEQIRKIADRVEAENLCGPSGKLVRIEAFAHGALCVAISGLCGMSLCAYNSPATRGACFQNCRRSYRVTDEQTGAEFLIENRFVMSPKDICTAGMLDRLLGAGVSVLKIEGRGRSADYVHTAVSVYREAADACLDGSFTQEKALAWVKRLDSVFNRGFWLGAHYLGESTDKWCGVRGSAATETKTQLGKVLNYYHKSSIAHLALEADDLRKGDRLLITGPTTGAVYMDVDDIHIEDKVLTHAPKGSDVTFKVPVKLRKNDKVYLVKTA